MAELLDAQGAHAEQPSAPDAGQQEEFVDINSPAATEPADTTPPADDVADDNEVPEKYRGKSPAEIIQMHQQAEQLLGRQSSEVGELRRVVDGFIAGQQAQPTATQEPEAKIDFFDNPEAAVAAAIDNHPKIKQAEQATARMQRTAAVASLQAKHPDLPDVLGDPAFMSWVNESPTRKRLYDEADNGYSAESADELVSNWKERKQFAESTVQVEKAARTQQKQAAATGVTTGSGETSKKIYRRSDIVKLMQTDPQRYQRLQPEIMKAYEEKRVR